jgi:hypothetical protein
MYVSELKGDISPVVKLHSKRNVGHGGLRLTQMYFRAMGGVHSTVYSMIFCRENSN